MDIKTMTPEEIVNLLEEIKKNNIKKERNKKTALKYSTSTKGKAALRRTQKKYYQRIKEEAKEARINAFNDELALQVKELTDALIRKHFPKF